MNKDKYFTDIYVHLHPDSLSDDRKKLEKELGESSGVFSVHFNEDEIRNAMFVAHNPETVSSDTLLEIIRESYVGAVSVAGTLTGACDNATPLNSE